MAVPGPRARLLQEESEEGELLPDPVKLTKHLNVNTQIITSIFKLPPNLAKGGKKTHNLMKKFKMPTLI